jgi:hypothetical protein
MWDTLVYCVQTLCKSSLSVLKNGWRLAYGKIVKIFLYVSMLRCATLIWWKSLNSDGQ